MSRLWECIRRCFRRKSAAKVATFAEKRAEWLEWLKGEDENSIMNHINMFIRDRAGFWIVTQAIDLADPAMKGHVKLNGLVFNMVRHTYYRSQVMVIRALLDKREDVYSLRRIIRDMKKHYQLITRENVLRELGTEYDLDAAKKRFCEWDARQTQGEAHAVPEEVGFGRCEKKHEFMDKVCDVAPNNRMRTDTISLPLLDSFVARLAKCDSIRIHATKFVAHLATPESRDRTNSESDDIDLEKIYAAQMSLLEIAQFLTLLLDDSLTLVSGIELDDPLKYLDRPIVDPVKMQLLRSRWEKYKEEVNASMTSYWEAPAKGRNGTE